MLGCACVAPLACMCFLVGVVALTRNARAFSISISSLTSAPMWGQHNSSVVMLYTLTDTHTAVPRLSWRESVPAHKHADIRGHIVVVVVTKPARLARTDERTKRQSNRKHALHAMPCHGELNLNIRRHYRLRQCL